MRNPEAHDLVAFATRRPGAFRRDDAELRWSANALKSATRAGLVVRVLPGVYSSTAHADALLTRAHAAHLWLGPQAVLTGAAAVAAWGLTPPPEVLVVAVPHGTQRPCPPWLRLRRCSELPQAATWNGVPIARPDHAVVTAFAELGPHEGRRVIYRAVNEQLATAPSLLRAEAVMPRVRHRAALRQVIHAVARGAESPLEDAALRRVFNLREFSSFVRQHVLTVDGVRYRTDMFHHGTLTAVELDGADHLDSANRLKDVRRDARLAAAGVLTLRFAGRDLLSDPEWCRGIVRRTVAARVSVGNT